MCKCPDGNQSLLWHSVIHSMQIHAEHGQRKNKTLMGLKCERGLCCRLSNTDCLDTTAKEGAWISQVQGLLPALEMAEVPSAHQHFSPQK